VCQSGSSRTAYRSSGSSRRRCSGARTAGSAIVATGFPFRRKDLLEGYEPAFAAALRRFEDLRRAGAASLDLCWTAEGVFDGYFELRLGPWDVAAGAVIVREAGGVVTDWSGDDEGWLRTGNILAGPPAMHAALLEIAVSAP
jgi:myo-inositol-1(or 4)-monophosphatase